MIISDNSEINTYINSNLYLEGIVQLYYKLVEEKLFLVYVEDGLQKDYRNQNLYEFLPLAFKTDDNCSWDVNISMIITPEQEALVFNGHKKWIESFPKLVDMNKFFDREVDCSLKPVEKDNKEVNDLVKKVLSLKPSLLKSFLEELSFDIDEVYKEYEAGYASTFIEKAAWEVGKILDESNE